MGPGSLSLLLGAWKPWKPWLSVSRFPLPQQGAWEPRQRQLKLRLSRFPGFLPLSQTPRPTGSLEQQESGSPRNQLALKFRSSEVPSRGVVHMARCSQNQQTPRFPAAAGHMKSIFCFRNIMLQHFQNIFFCKISDSHEIFFGWGGMVSVQISSYCVCGQKSHLSMIPRLLVSTVHMATKCIQDVIGDILVYQHFKANLMAMAINGLHISFLTNTGMAKEEFSSAIEG